MLGTMNGPPSWGHQVASQQIWRERRHMACHPAPFGHTPGLALESWDSFLAIRGPCREQILHNHCTQAAITLRTVYIFITVAHPGHESGVLCSMLLAFEYDYDFTSYGLRFYECLLMNVYLA